MALVSRVALALVLAAGLAVAAVRATCARGAAPVAAPCSAAALSAAYTHVDSVQGYGCDDGFGYLWMTVGSGVGEVGVTEVVRYDAPSARWVNARRLYWCADHRLPGYVDRWGCHSN